MKKQTDHYFGTWNDVDKFFITEDGKVGLSVASAMEYTFSGDEISDLIAWLRESQRERREGGRLTIKYEFDIDAMRGDDDKLVKRLIKNTDMALALWDIHNRLIHDLEIKFETEYEKTEEPQGSSESTWYEVLRLVGEKINDILSDNNIDVEELID